MQRLKPFDPKLSPTPDPSRIETELGSASAPILLDSHCSQGRRTRQTRIKSYQAKDKISALQRRLRSVAFIGWTLIAGFVMAGCGGNAAGRASSNGNSALRDVRTRGVITGINMMTGPVAINMDQDPGLDGISVRLFFTDADNPKAVTISSGMVDVLMFDGLFVPGKDAPPLRKQWTFTAEQLESVRYQSALGEAYELLLAWGEDSPDNRAISVVARYTRSDDTYVLSGSSSISVMDAFRQPPAYR